MVKLKPVNPNLDAYLHTSVIINWQNPKITELAQLLADPDKIEENTAKNCFLWVREHIKHSWDFQLNPVTCIASDVLKHKTGYCYAKAHLLAALLRANGIPTGFCYQRLCIEENGPPFCLHGLNAVYLQQFGWYRIDPRGNKENINAQFDPPNEQLAFNLINNEEKNFTDIWCQPLPTVINTLQNNSTYQQVYLNLPDDYQEAWSNTTFINKNK